MRRGDMAKKNKGEETRIVGAGIGGATGAMIGAAVGGPVGAVIGAGVTALVGHWAEGELRK
jgi:outer membrane lipoprotein SlyB